LREIALLVMKEPDAPVPPYKLPSVEKAIRLTVREWQRKNLAKVAISAG
jgi:hypothetical protein